MAWYDFPITQRYHDTHYALDIATPYNTPITAFKSGTVRQANYADWGGEVFIKPDDGGPEYYFYHLDDIKVKPGQKVKVGDLIGYSGGQTSGGKHPHGPPHSYGPHTHVGNFTGYKNTVIGMRPFGPDITGTINFLKTGGRYEDAYTPTQQIANTNQASKASTALTSTGVFLIALLLVAGGAYITFQKSIDSAVKRII